MLAEDLAGVAHLRLDVIARAVAGILGHAEVGEAILANAHQDVGLDHQAEHLAVVDGLEFFRRVDAEHQGHVGDLEAAMRQIRRQRCLAGARDAHQDQIRLGQIARLGAVVVLDGEFDRFDAAEIIFGDRVQEARYPGRRSAEKASELADERAHQVDGFDVVPIDELGDQLALFVVHHGEHHERLHLGRLLEDLLALGFEPNTRIGANLHLLLELQRGGADHSLSRVAGRVTDDKDRLHSASAISQLTPAYSSSASA